MGIINNLFYVFLTLLILAFGQVIATCPVRIEKPDKKTNIHTASEYNRTMNVKTVLFSVKDTCKVCWSSDELNLLIARRFMQDLIPKRIPRDFSALLDHINNCISTVKSKTSGKITQTMLMALYDALGGYLHSVVVPILNEAYYAGNADYSTTSQLHYLLGQMMAFLGTNGASWANPCDMSKIPTKVASLPIRMCAEEEACKIFVLLDHKHKLVNEPVSSDNESVPACSSSGLKIQIPFLDDNAYPSAIAVPLKDHALFSLMSECSVNIIPKYYIMAMRCLASSQYTTRDIVNFNHMLHRWIVSSVVPHLHELDRWYPGFGGVMRVVETMNRRGLSTADPIKPNIKSPSVNFTNCFGKESCSFSSSMSSSNIYLKIFYWFLIILAGLLLIVLLITLLRCLFVRFVKKKSNDDDVNTLVSLYCGLREPSTQGDEKTNMKTSRSKTYATVSSYSPSTSGEGSE